MKITVLVIILLIVPALSFAQPVKKDFVLGISLGTSVSKQYVPENEYGNYRSRTSVINFMLNAEFFVSDRFSIGLSGGYNESWRNNYGPTPDCGVGYSDAVKDALIFVSPVVKYYIPVSKKLFFSLKATPGYGRMIQHPNESNNSIGSNDRVYDIEGNMFFGEIIPGLDYFIGKRWVVGATAGGLRYSYGKVEGTAYKDFGLDWGNLAFTLSIRF